MSSSTKDTLKGIKLMEKQTRGKNETLIKGDI